MGLIVGTAYMYSIRYLEWSGSMLPLAIGPLSISFPPRISITVGYTRWPTQRISSHLRPVMAGTSANDCFVMKWGCRLVFLCLAYAACQWLDKIKVRRVGSCIMTTRGILISRL